MPKTTKLFYNKWPYKIALWQKGSWFIKRLGLEVARKRCDPGYRYKWAHLSFEDQVELNRFIDAVEPFLKENIQIRSENSRFSIYCDDRALLDRMIQDLKPWTLDIFKPATEAELDYITNSSSNKVICTNIPFDRFHYKVYIRRTINPDTRISFVKWVENYPDSLRVPKATLEWLNGNSNWAWTPFVYVESTSMLSMVGLFLGNNIQKIEEFIPRTDINIR